MMLKLLLILFTALFFQACQVQEQVASANQIAPTYFPGAKLTTVLPNNGWKKLGDTLDISLLFPLPITVGGLPYKPYIEAVIGSNIRQFYYYSGSGATTLIFRYTVVAADLDTDGISFGSSVKMNNATMTFSPSVGLVENVPTELIISNSDIKVDGIKPTVSSIATPISGKYTTGLDMIYKFACSEEVYVAGSPYFNVLFNSGTVPAVYKTGSGTTLLEFSRVIQASDLDTNGFGSISPLTFNAALGETIVDQAGNTLSTVIPTTNTTTVIVNPTQPTISTIVATSAPGTYTATQNIDFTVTMSTPVTVTGTPAIPVVLSTGTVQANYLNGSGSNTLYFRYVVQTNHADTDGITLQSPMILNGASIKATASGNADAALIYTIPGTSGILVDAATGPFVLSTMANSSLAPANGFYIEGQNLDFSLNFSAVVNVLPLIGVLKPRIPIIVGTTTVYADYFSGSGTNALVFRYSPTTTHEDLDGISLLGPIDLNTGTIKDALNKPAILSFAPISTSNIYVDGTTPNVISVTSSSVGTFIQGTSLSYAVKFSEPVSIIGVNPALSITVGSTPQSATYVSGDGTDTLNFQYIVQTGDSDSGGILVSSMSAVTLKDLRGHLASLAFGSVNLVGAIVDASAAGISFITPPGTATYKIGTNLDFIVTWSEPTFISGTPILGLTVGATPKNATYVSSPTSMTSIFRYTVATGDSGSVLTTAMQLNGGQIRDAAGNNSSLTFPVPVLTGVLVDGVVPYVTSITPPPDLTYSTGQNLDFTVNWSEPVTNTGSPYLELTIGSTSVQAIKISATATSAVFRYKVLAGQLDTNGISMLSAIFLNGFTITDLAGNNSYLQIEPPLLTGVKVDAVPPMISGVLPPASGTYLYKDNIDFTVLWSEAVIISGSPRIGIRIGTNNYYATYVSPGSFTNSSIFRYTVGNNSAAHTLNESDANGITITSNLLDGSGNIINSYIELNSGSITDLALNTANVNFLAPTLTGVLVDGITAIVDPANPITSNMISGVHCLPANVAYCPGRIKLSFTVHWTKNIDVVLTGGTPYIEVNVSNVGVNIRNASYVSGTGTPNLVFSYDIVNGDDDTNGITVSGPVKLNGGSLQFQYTPFLVTYNLDAKLDFVVPASLNLSGITVDAVPPLRDSISSNGTIFKPGNNIDYSLKFNEPVTVPGSAPWLPITVGSTSTVASYDSGSGSDTLIYRYTVPAGNTVLDLDGVSVSSTLLYIAFFSGPIIDAYGNVFINGAQNFLQTNYVYYSNTLARYNANNYAFNALATCPTCVTQMNDISGGSNHLVPSAGAFGPQRISTGFALGASPYLLFNNSSKLNTTTNMSIKYVVFVMRSVTNGEVLTPAISNHRLLQRYSSAVFTPAIEFTSSIAAKSILLNPDQKVKINATTNFGPSHQPWVSSASLWANNTPYIMIFELDAATIFDPGSYFGGMDFDGQIAEIILLDGSATLSEIKLETIRDQLNTIHHAY